MDSLFKSSRTKVVAALLIAATTWSAQVSGQSADFPNRPIRIVIGNGAGGTSDIFMRLLGQHLTKKWGQPVIVEAKPGAGGAIASSELARAKPDGYTLGMVISNHATNPYLQKNMAYDTVKSFASVSMLAQVPTILSASKASGITSFDDVVARSKSEKGGLPFGSAGAGGMTHLVGELLKESAGLSLFHVPYKGGAAALNDLLGGQLTMMFSTVRLVAQHHQDGSVRAIAVASRERDEALPDVPTFAELGFPDVVVEEWYAMLAPAGTPSDVIAKLNKAINEILKEPELKEKMVGMNLVGSTPAELDSFIESEMERWSRVISAADLRME